MMAIGKNIKFHRKIRLNWTLADLENKSGVDGGTISALENRDSSKSDYFERIAHGLGLTMEQLLISPENWVEDDGWTIKYPEEHKFGFTDLVRTNSNISNSNTSAAPEVKGLVPIISWVQAGQWHEAIDFEHHEDLKYLPCPKSHSESTYALRVRGDSMTASYGKSYPENCIIFVDPELRNPTSGDRIIAKINGDAEVTFKVFMQEGDKKWLKPLNTQHPIITDEFKVLGKIIGKWEDE